MNGGIVWGSVVYFFAWSANATAWETTFEKGAVASIVSGTNAKILVAAAGSAPSGTSPNTSNPSSKLSMTTSSTTDVTMRTGPKAR